MPRYRLTLEYDGSGYNGFQAQADQPTVQGAVETAITAFCGQTVRLAAAGRTDTGVHATGQVVHVDLEKDWPAATVMNALAMQAALEKIGVQTRVQSALTMNAVAEPYVRRRALRHLEKGRVVIFAAGVGAPFFTTDSGAALRAAEMGCDALLKGTSVDGVYTADPKKDKSATRYETLTYHDVLARDLKVMDASAIALMRDSGIPIVVFSIREDNSLRRTLTGEGTFTVISSSDKAA